MGTPEVLGPYVIYERLGAGGMATVHRAEQIGLAGFRKQIALKRLLPHVAADPAMVKMFTHEARLASQLRHANVVQIYELGKHDETYFIAMEYVQGPTLAQIATQCATASGAIPIAMVLSILAQVCDALDHAHNLTDEAGRPLGIIHRDVSPANIIVANTGVVKLIDFGIAKAGADGASGDVKTQTGFVKGKYAYIAPEYTRGQLDARADLFGLGVIAHELLTSRRLFDAPTDFETIVRLREMAIQPPSRWNPQVPRDLDDIVMTALQRDPALRWQSASAMRTAIHNVARVTAQLVTTAQLADWVEWCLGKRPIRVDTNLAHAIAALDEPSASGTAELTTEQRRELDAIAARADAAARPTPAPAGRTSAHVIRRADADAPASRPAARESGSPWAVTPVVASRVLPLGGPREQAPTQERVVPVSLPLGVPPRGPDKATIVERVIDPGPPPSTSERSKRPSHGPQHAIALVLPPDQAAIARERQDAHERERAAHAAAQFPASEDSGVVITPRADEDRAPRAETALARTPRRWPWLLLALVLAAGVAAYLVGVVPDP